MTARLLVVAPPDSDAHDTGRGHPERRGRVEAALAGVTDAHLDDAVVFDTGRDATRDELTLVHDARYVDALDEFARRGGGHLDADTVVAPGSFAAATRAAGAGLRAVEALSAGEADAAFVVVRPPGHHAVATRGQGFCLFNNIAVAAATLAGRGERVLIVDWDVHHGNGTQDMFWDDPRVLFVSTHQYPAYPGTGRANERGVGNILNAPLPPQADGLAFRAAWTNDLLPALEAFRPQLLLVSAGFDAHRRDPLAQLRLEADDYTWVTAELRAIADRHARGRIVSSLEGGYDLQALHECAVAHVGGLLAQ
jgi:acetoin utilization deacetylase AcuC-like enzyme